jgi:hypothetical protein
MPAVLGQIGFVGAVVVQHGHCGVIERGEPDPFIYPSSAGMQAGSPAGEGHRPLA